VELDVLTGQYYVLRADIVYDNGVSLSPIVDIGQIEGAFIMGLGFFLNEHMVTMPDGRLITNSTWEYKPPTTKDIPIEFNILLLPDEPNTAAVNVYQSKATGEPPLMLAQAAYWALKECILSARINAGTSQFFTLDTPATVEHVQKVMHGNIHTYIHTYAQQAISTLLY
jgi:xanthine dehydrogenase/oxidase